MSKNKFRTLFFMLVLQFGVPTVDLSSTEQPFQFMNMITLVLDIVINFTLLVAYIYFFAMMIIYGYRAWMEDSSDEKINKTLIK